MLSTMPGTFASARGATKAVCADEASLRATVPAPADPGARRPRRPPRGLLRTAARRKLHLSRDKLPRARGCASVRSQLWPSDTSLPRSPSRSVTRAAPAPGRAAGTRRDATAASGPVLFAAAQRPGRRGGAEGSARQREGTARGGGAGTGSESGRRALP